MSDNTIRPQVKFERYTRANPGTFWQQPAGVSEPKDTVDTAWAGNPNHHSCTTADTAQAGNSNHHGCTTADTAQAGNSNHHGCTTADTAQAYGGWNLGL